MHMTQPSLLCQSGAGTKESNIYPSSLADISARALEMVASLLLHLSSFCVRLCKHYTFKAHEKQTYTPQRLMGTVVFLRVAVNFSSVRGKLQCP